MKIVLICDFCSHIEILGDEVKMTEHEKNCSLNIIMIRKHLLSMMIHTNMVEQN